MSVKRKVTVPVGSARVLAIVAFKAA